MYSSYAVFTRCTLCNQTTADTSRHRGAKLIVSYSETQRNMHFRIVESSKSSRDTVYRRMQRF